MQAAGLLVVLPSYTTTAFTLSLQSWDRDGLEATRRVSKMLEQAGHVTVYHGRLKN